jgi:hypothetical protein
MRRNSATRQSVANQPGVLVARLEMVRDRPGRTTATQCGSGPQSCKCAERLQRWLPFTATAAQNSFASSSLFASSNLNSSGACARYLTRHNPNALSGGNGFGGMRDSRIAGGCKFNSLCSRRRQSNTSSLSSLASPPEDPPVAAWLCNRSTSKLRFGRTCWGSTNGVTHLQMRDKLSA